MLISTFHRITVAPMMAVMIIMMIIVTTRKVLANDLAIGDLLRTMLNASVYNKNLRPNFGGPPVYVNVSLYVLTISSVSEIDMDFTIDFYFRQHWHDPRLAFDPIANQSELYLGDDLIPEIWKPDTFVSNSKRMHHHETVSSGKKSSFLRIAHTGHVFYSTRLTVTVDCPMNLQHFPMDRQQCEIFFESYAYPTRDLNFEWKEGQVFEISENISLPTMQIIDYRHVKRVETLSSGSYDKLLCTVAFQRSISYYLYQIYIPAFLIVVISWIPFWLARDHHARVGLGVTTVLTITTLATSTMATLPKVSYLKAIDIYLFLCFCMVFLSLIEYATVGFFELAPQNFDSNSKEENATGSNNSSNNSSNNDRRTSKQDSRSLLFKNTSCIDYYSRAVFPLVFMTCNLVYAWYMFCMIH